ncbi:NETI motif-containing protein [Bacillus sp. B1-b2]|uniref:NETI motif-containing protein n=1 Tax=Bacillus sp. B1-b2 TaxID=2653201 RepID=UPI001261C87C|nr:NETI motif-containing protein [Bacillus sp. B1-b2]KAB7672432.1 NETI motif-containing protein [Bacillus sp. B1-b2]
MSKKKKFEVQTNESISECLDRIKKEGYMPIKRMEKPIFQEVKNNGQLSYEPISQQIIFEAIQIEG